MLPTIMMRYIQLIKNFAGIHQHTVATKKILVVPVDIFRKIR
ncbi:MAG TPA: hypothetical protein VK203_27435 [Nostocaceae cyanobacterium]|nr:hypothetical protein [Nostocaceae cyanobacterium]